MSSTSKSASVQQRLLNLAQTRGEDYNQTLTRYAGLRFLSRLSNSPFYDRFLLKGATMFLIWSGSMHRPTSDIDLLGFVDEDEVTLKEIFHQVCMLEIEDDGIVFDPDSIQVSKIREETAYGGMRCLVYGSLGSAKVRVQVDIGFGDVVTPTHSIVEIPRLLPDEVRREINAYTPESVIAEKFEAIVKLGLANSRMKDYLDLVLLLSEDNTTSHLPEAIRQTFKRRKTTLPTTLPIGLTEEFWSDELAQRRWKAFMKKNRLPDESLESVCQRIGSKLEAHLQQISGESPA